jgi:hypothetical protein
MHTYRKQEEAATNAVAASSLISAIDEKKN